jgi:hypothetical protein
VLREALIHLPPSDLSSVRRVCRAWNPVAQDLLFCRTRLKRERINRFICGLGLSSIVGFKNNTIKTLDLDVKQYGRQDYEFVTILVPYLAPTLSILRLCYENAGFASIFVLDDFLAKCDRIRCLQLEGFDCELHWLGQRNFWAAVKE